uniref:Uncharacterized protein n=1 Tax=Aliivibrio wodanis TaxID=80852 RepID=A0A5Q4ZY89_9GAMM|nr:hypothetical protein [Aliivibrio wodanis]VVV06836.1 hypothetical protein AW0309160_04330 [Aliivibrio wodanis]
MSKDYDEDKSLYEEQHKAAWVKNNLSQLAEKEQGFFAASIALIIIDRNLFNSEYLSIVDAFVVKHVSESKRDISMSELDHEFKAVWTKLAQSIAFFSKIDQVETISNAIEQRDDTALTTISTAFAQQMQRVLSEYVRVYDKKCTPTLDQYVATDEERLAFQSFVVNKIAQELPSLRFASTRKLFFYERAKPHVFDALYKRELYYLKLIRELTRNAEDDEFRELKKSFKQQANELKSHSV